MRHFSLVFLCLMFCISCTKIQNVEQRISGSALGTTYQIIYFGNQDSELITAAMDSIFKVVNLSLSTYQKDSDISKINAGDTTIVVDDMFTEVFKLSKDISEKSKGYFDPTVGNLVNVYGFGAERFSQKIDSTLIDSLKQFVGFEKVAITTEKRIQKQFSQTYLEFNAIAKGYCLDRMAVYLDNQKISNYLIELGGELVAKGNKGNDETPWLAGIEKPNEDGTRSVAKTVALVNRSMATSGNYRKYKVDKISGKKYVHTINPKTGYPEQNDMLSASVFASTCAEADGWATAFMALGVQKSKEVLQKLDEVDVYFMYINSNGDFETFSSDGISEFIN